MTINIYICNSFLVDVTLYCRYGLRPLVCSVGVTILASIIVTAYLAANDDALPLVISIFRLNM